MHRGSGDAARRPHPPTQARFAGARAATDSSAGRSPCRSTTPHPTANTTRIAISRRRASGPDAAARFPGVQLRRPGRPGHRRPCAVSPPVVPRAIQDRYDLVSFDPRGTGGSRAIDCVSDKVADRLYAADPTPTTDAELRGVLRRHRRQTSTSSRGCIAKNGSWLARVGSRNVARDLDRLRAALGDPPAQLHRFLVRHRHRVRLRAAVPRSRRPDGARRAGRPLRRRSGNPRRRHREFRTRPRTPFSATAHARRAASSDPVGIHARRCARFAIGSRTA